MTKEEDLTAAVVSLIDMTGEVLKNLLVLARHIAKIEKRLMNLEDRVTKGGH